MEITIEKLESLLTVKQVAERFGVRPGVVRKAVKKGTIPGAIKVFKTKDGFDPDLVADWVPPEPGEYGVRSPKREDGRRKYHAFLLPAEVEKLEAEGYEVVDPRVAAKARRAAKKAAEAGEASEAGEVNAAPASDSDANPFSDF